MPTDHQAPARSSDGCKREGSRTKRPSGKSSWPQPDDSKLRHGAHLDIDGGNSLRQLEVRGRAAVQRCCVQVSLDLWMTSARSLERRLDSVLATDEERIIFGMGKLLSHVHE